MSVFSLFLRHQFGAIMATAVDFSVMICWVEVFHGSPVVGTAIGAGCGALTSFLLGRRWVFQATSSSARWQAFRYALVATASLGLNSLGEYFLHRVLKLPYVPSRMIIAALVGTTWNFQMQRRFVFRGGQRDRPPAPAS